MVFSIWNCKFMVLGFHHYARSLRFDRIFLRNTYPLKFPKLITCDVFGTKVYSEINLSASDHYGVYAVIESE